MFILPVYVFMLLLKLNILPLKLLRLVIDAFALLVNVFILLVKFNILELKLFVLPV